MNPLLPIHIAGGSAAILAGAAALSLRKGSRGHARAGLLFVAGMAVMATMAVPLALAKPDPGIAVGAVLTLYLVATAKATASNRAGTAGRFEIAALGVVLACLAAFLACARLAASSAGGTFHGSSAAFYGVWAGFATLAAALDLNFILRGTLTRLQRLRRHLWRMCTSLFVASGSFFLGQQKVMPAVLQGSPWLFVPALAPLALMLFWLVRVRFVRALGGQPTRAPAGVVPEPARA